MGWSYVRRTGALAPSHMIRARKRLACHPHPALNAVKESNASTHISPCLRAVRAGVKLLDDTRDEEALIGHAHVERVDVPRDHRVAGVERGPLGRADGVIVPVLMQRLARAVHPG